MSIWTEDNNPFRYTHLFNPLYTVMNTGESTQDTPGIRFSDNDKLNLAIWNSIYVAALAGPLAYLANTVANRKYDEEVEQKLDSSLVSKVEALRPRLVSDPNLMDTSSYTTRPKKELKELNKLKDTLISKKAAEGVSDWVSDKGSDMLQSAVLSTIPLIAMPAAAIGGISLATKVDKKRIKDRLKEQRIQIRNIQAYQDRKIMEHLGLVAAEPDESGKGSAKKTKKGVAKKAATKESLPKQLLIDVPTGVVTIGSLLLGGAAYNVLKDNDENIAKIKYLKRRQLGSNTGQSTPQISVLDLPVRTENILATPGLASSDTAYEDPARIITEFEGVSAKKAKAKKKEDTKSKDTDTKDNESSDSRKKDAIF